MQVRVFDFSVVTESEVPVVPGTSDVPEVLVPIDSQCDTTTSPNISEAPPVLEISRPSCKNQLHS